jgi:single-strand DNA-binding protein
MRVIVTCRLAQRTHDTENDGKRTVYEIQAHEVGVSLRSATARVTRADLGQAEDTASGNGDEPPF